MSRKVDLSQKKLEEELNVIIQDISDEYSEDDGKEYIFHSISYRLLNFVILDFSIIDANYEHSDNDVTDKSDTNSVLLLI